MATILRRSVGDWTILAAPFVAILAARFATHSDLAGHYPRLSGLLFLWIAADSLTLALIAKAPERRPGMRAVLGTLAVASAVALLGAAAPVRDALLDMTVMTTAMALTGAAYLGWSAWTAWQTYRSSGRASEAASAILPASVVKMASFEIAMMKLALSGWRSPPHVPAGARAFAGHRIENQMIGVMLALQIIEIGVVHLLVSHWSPTAALILLAMGVWGLLFTLALMNALRRYPAALGEREFRFRVGVVTELVVPVAQIVAVEPSISDAQCKGREVLRATVLTHPNVVLRIDPPLIRSDWLGRERRIERIALRIDEPVPLVAALSARI